TSEAGAREAKTSGRPARHDVGVTRIGILTGGGDVPGLNSIMKSVVYRGWEIGWETIGIRHGWKGLTHLGPAGASDAEFVVALSRDNTRRIDRSCATVLRTSLTNPARMKPDRLPEELDPARLPGLEVAEGR